MQDKSYIEQQLEELKREKGLLPPLEENPTPEALAEEAEKAAGEEKEIPSEEDNKEEEVESPEAKEPEEEASDPAPNATGYQKMRVTNKALKEELEATRDRLAKLEGRFEERTAVATPPTAPAPAARAEEEDKEPDPLYDQEAHNAWKLRRIEKENQQIKEEVANFQRQSLDMQHRQILGSLEDAYAKANPDYTAAKKYLRDVQIRALKVSNPKAKDEELELAVSNAELDEARSQAKQGRHPSQYFHDLAKALGYRPEEKPKSEGNTPPKTANLDAIRRNKEKAAGFIGSPGRGTPGRLTSDQLADMTVEQFARLTPEEKESMRSGIAGR